jgi:hypothetical protein
MVSDEASAALNLVGHILRMSAGAEVIWIAAGRVVARMADQAIARVGAICESPSSAIRVHDHTVEMEAPVISCRLPARR